MNRAQKFTITTSYAEFTSRDNGMALYLGKKYGGKDAFLLRFINLYTYSKDTVDIPQIYIKMGARQEEITSLVLTR